MNKLNIDNDEVDQFRKWVSTTLKGKGFTAQPARRTSALVEHTFVRGTTRLSMSGWHGTGRPGTNRFYGAGKSIFNVCVYEASTFKPVGRVATDHTDVEAQRTLMNDAKKLITAL